MKNHIRDLRQAAGLSMQALADRAGTSRQQIHKLEHGERRLTDIWLRRLAGALNCRPVDILGEWAESATESAADDAAPSPQAFRLEAAGAKPMRVDDKELIPVYASAQGGPDGTLLTYDPIEYVDRPEPLFGVRGAFAMYVVSDSMEPKYSQGALLLVHPTRPVRRGDFVLVVKQSIGDEHSALVKQLVRVGEEELVLRQFNPPSEFEIPRENILGIHLVVGSFESR
ncbi:MAG: S24 family peptidase [Alphaproteobacteria bacterium]|jgi:phage repressor protein C with HTH and peptisase S24 domain|nr:S24 family peptidase [Alphaproteobacteria bacterium]